MEFEKIACINEIDWKDHEVAAQKDRSILQQGK